MLINQNTQRYYRVDLNHELEIEKHIGHINYRTEIENCKESKLCFKIKLFADIMKSKYITNEIN